MQCCYKGKFLISLLCYCVIPGFSVSLGYQSIQKYRTQVQYFLCWVIIGVKAFQKACIENLATYVCMNGTHISPWEEITTDFFEFNRLHLCTYHIAVS